MTLHLLAALIFCSSLSAQEDAKSPKPAEFSIARPDETPWILRWMIRPLNRKKGMLVRLPIMDTDPNRGTTVGFMPIWIVQEGPNDRIEHIHAPSLTYNKTFKAIPTYRYYYYPTDTSSLIARAATSQHEERELLLQLDDERFRNKNMIVGGRIQYNVDGARRFFGIGSNTPKKQEANYIDNVLQYHWSVGVPIVEGTKWKVYASNRLAAQRILQGRTPNITPFDTTFPGVRPHRRQQSNQLGWAVGYDSRDHSVTTGGGTYLKVSGDHSVRGFASAFDFNRYALDARYFLRKTPDSNIVTAYHLKAEQLTNRAPFWLMPSLGGKYNLRAYGEGRYVDRGMLSYNVEQRYTLHKIPLAGVVTEFEVAPFVGVGTVFHTPRLIKSRHFRPVYGVAVRAVAKPQVVGSIDFGIGQEGLAAFIDINYSF